MGVKGVLRTGRSHVSALGEGVGAEAAGLPANLAEAEAGREPGAESIAGPGETARDIWQVSASNQLAAGRGRGKRASSSSKKLAHSSRAASPLANFSMKIAESMAILQNPATPFAKFEVSF